MDRWDIGACPAAVRRRSSGTFWRCSACLRSFRRSGREAVRALIACLAETPEEGRALFGVLVQQKTLEAAAGAAGVSPRKLSRLRKKFLEQMPL